MFPNPCAVFDTSAAPGGQSTPAEEGHEDHRGTNQYFTAKLGFPYRVPTGSPQVPHKGEEEEVQLPHPDKLFLDQQKFSKLVWYLLRAALVTFLVVVRKDLGKPLQEGSVHFGSQFESTVPNGRHGGRKMRQLVTLYPPLIAYFWGQVLLPEASTASRKSGSK